MHIVLVHPQIAPNTGNIIRLCANLGAELHVVKPIGFSMDDRLLRRGGLDYHDLVHVTVHESYADARQAVGGRWLALTGKGATRYDQVDYAADDVLVFGCEATGLPGDIMEQFGEGERVAIPMRPGNRSLNLGNAVAVVAYEAWRQLDFDGAGASASTLEALNLVPARTDGVNHG